MLSGIIVGIAVVAAIGTLAFRNEHSVRYHVGLLCFGVATYAIAHSLPIEKIRTEWLSVYIAIVAIICATPIFFLRSVGSAFSFPISERTSLIGLLLTTSSGTLAMVGPAQYRTSLIAVFYLLALGACVFSGWIIISRRAAILRLTRSSILYRSGLVAALAAVAVYILDILFASMVRMGFLSIWLVELRLAIMVVLFAFALFAIAKLFLRPNSKKSKGKVARIESDDEAALRLNSLMETERLWANESLSQRALSEAIDVPVYRLRRIIRGYLGFANFRAYLNDQRIRHAKHLLSQSDLSIIEVAFEVGFGSLSSFNRAFKAALGTTPMTWRKHNKQR